MARKQTPKPGKPTPRVSRQDARDGGWPYGGSEDRKPARKTTPSKGAGKRGSRK